MTAKDFPAGIKVQIAKCKDFPCAVGKWATVCAHQDCPGKIKVSFDDQWQGYFAPEQLVAITKVRQQLFDLLKERDSINKSIFGLTHDLETITQEINKMVKRHKLCPQCGAPLQRDPCRDESIWKRWSCPDRNCRGFIIE